MRAVREQKEGNHYYHLEQGYLALFIVLLLAGFVILGKWFNLCVSVSLSSKIWWSWGLNELVHVKCYEENLTHVKVIESVLCHNLVKRALTPHDQIYSPNQLTSVVFQNFFNHQSLEIELLCKATRVSTSFVKLRGLETQGFHTHIATISSVWATPVSFKVSPSSPIYCNLHHSLLHPWQPFILTAYTCVFELATSPPSRADFVCTLDMPSRDEEQTDKYRERFQWKIPKPTVLS